MVKYISQYGINPLRKESDGSNVLDCVTDEMREYIFSSDTIDKLKTENAELKADIEMLKCELEHIKAYNVW